MLIGIKKSLSSFSIPTNSSLEIAWAGCTTATKRILIGACYRPPAADPKFTDNLRQSLEMATHSFPSDYVYLLGDFNFPQIDWLTLSSSCHNSNNFLNFSLDFNLFQVVNEPTRESNTLDLILTTAPETVETISCLDGFSDHKLLQLSLRIPLAHAGTVTKKIRDFSRANYVEINSHLEHFFHEKLLPNFTDRTIEENWVLYRNYMATLIDLYVPLITITNDKTNPWFNRSLHRLRNTKKRLYRATKRGSNPSAFVKYKEFLKTYASAICDAKKSTTLATCPLFFSTIPKSFGGLLHLSRTISTLHYTMLTKHQCLLASVQLCLIIFFLLCLREKTTAMYHLYRNWTGAIWNPLPLLLMAFHVSLLT